MTQPHNASHATTIPVRWGDVDLAGIAFYPRFYEWYDLGCEALFASLGLAWPEAFPKYGIIGVPILESGRRSRRPSATATRSPSARLWHG